MPRLAIALAGVLALAACAADPGGTAPTSAPAAMNDDDAQIAQGERLVSLSCLTCHVIASAAPPRNAEAPPLSTLAERYPGTLLEDAFPQRMRVGHPAMPDFAFTDAQVDAILAYLLSIQERQGA